MQSTRNQQTTSAWQWLALAFVLTTRTGDLGAGNDARTADAPLSPQATARQMQLPEGFRATVFAAEPDIVQPIAFTFDDRGRLWVVECLSYPDWRENPDDGRDRVIILEDTGGDGQFDKRTVFWDRGSNLTGIELGFGGVWLCSTPNLVFVPNRDRDDRPDGPPEIVLDGWDLEAKHNAFNGLTWGPDGWLYGCNGILSNSKVGRPGTPDEARIEFNCGVWRVHPVTRQFEPVAWGTTNPWGLDFDAHGRMFITNCVIKHVFHVVPGGHYARMYGQDLNPHVYELMASCADHIHWGGGEWTSSRGGEGAHDAPGGGHAHAGCMIYQGNNWPAAYRGNMFTCNIHGNRVNQDRLEAGHSGYVARHGRDFLSVPDSWFRGLELKSGPDGGVFLTDWSDTGECHDYEDIHRENGRIYKITFGDVPPAKINLDRLTDRELVALQFHDNEWHVRHARRILHERAAAGTLAPWPKLRTALAGDRSPTLDETGRELRTLWLRHVTGNLGDAELQFALQSDRDLIRAWAVRLELDDRRVSATMLSRFAALARSDPSPVVRLFLSSGLQRLPVAQRWDVAAGLITHAEDNDDPNLPLMAWYGVEPLVAADSGRAAGLVATAGLPIIRRHAARRMTSLDGGIKQVVNLIARLSRSENHPAVFDLLAGLHHELKGRRNVPPPSAWKNLSHRLRHASDEAVRDLSTRVALLFGDRDALAELRGTVDDRSASIEDRRRAIATLAHISDATLPATLKRIVAEQNASSKGGPSLVSAALQALAVFDDGDIPELILARYRKLSGAERSDAVSTLAARPAGALALLTGIERGTIPRKDLSAFTARQLAELGDERVTSRLKAVWGDVRQSSRDRLALRESYRQRLTPESLAKADRVQGRLVFRRTCAACHVLFDEGRRVGPELTGAQRTSLDYLLENILEPGAVVGRDYKVTTVLTAAGRVISGIITEETTSSLTIQTETEAVIIAKDGIEDRRQQNVSMMPEGIIEKLSDEELRNLVAYLMGDAQVPLPTP